MNQDYNKELTMKENNNVIEITFPLDIIDCEDYPLSHDIQFDLRNTVLTCISPETFLKMASPLKHPSHEYARNVVKRLKERIENKEELDPIELGFRNGKVVYHEGRHRAIASVLLGIKKIPILIHFPFEPLYKNQSLLEDKMDEMIKENGNFIEEALTLQKNIAYTPAACTLTEKELHCQLIPQEE